MSDDWQRWVPVTEAAELVGMNISHVRRLAKSGEITAHKLGKMWMIDRLTLRDKRHARRQVTMKSRQQLHDALLEQFGPIYEQMPDHPNVQIFIDGWFAGRKRRRPSITQETIHGHDPAHDHDPDPGSADHG